MKTLRLVGWAQHLQKQTEATGTAEKGTLYGAGGGQLGGDVQWKCGRQDATGKLDLGFSDAASFTDAAGFGALAEDQTHSQPMP